MPVVVHNHLFVHGPEYCMAAYLMFATMSTIILNILAEIVKPHTVILKLRPKMPVYAIVDTPILMSIQTIILKFMKEKVLMLL
jgi:hypothetical protein